MKITVNNGNALNFKADVLALKYAQALFGVDYAVVERLSEEGIDISNSLPKISESLLISSKEHIAAKSILFIGVQDLSKFKYQEIQTFAHEVLCVLATKAPQTRHICLTMHGVGYGLDETQAFEAEINGLLSAIKQRKFPKQLKKITIIERDEDRVARLKINLSKLVPNDVINLYESEEINREVILSLLAAIKFSTQVLSTLSTNFDQYILQEFINQAIKHFADITTKTSKLFDDVNIHVITEICQDLHVKANMLTFLPNEQIAKDPQSLIQFIITVLNPFQVSIEVAWFKLHNYEKKEIADFCYIIGITILLIHYTLIEQNIPTLKKNLTDKIKEVQNQILNEIGLKLIPKNEFPWDNISQLLSGDTDNLVKLYQLSLNKSTHIESIEYEQT